ncbi:MAG: hypothetical protein QOE15_1002 [Acidimicrobiaceae bacterium]|nr:hypothetical protein [Acidimicrobiaceae bacterium]
MSAPSPSTGAPVAYGIALAVHVATALVGFATLASSGLYGSWGRRLRTWEELRDVRRYFEHPNRSGQVLWLVPLTGGVALWLRHGVSALGQAWVIASMVCWALATVLAVSVIWPAERRIRPIVAGLDRMPDVPDPGHVPLLPAALGPMFRSITRAAAFCDLAFTVALALMVLRPGR